MCAERYSRCEPFVNLFKFWSTTYAKKKSRSSVQGRVHWLFTCQISTGPARRSHCRCGRASAGAGVRGRLGGVRCGGVGHCHPRGFHHGRSHGRALSDQRTHRRDVRGADRAGATLWSHRHLGRGLVLGCAPARYRPPAPRSLYRLHPGARHQRLHLGHRLIIFIGQIDNFLGIKTPGTETAAQKFLGYFKGGLTPDFQSLALGLVVIATMLFMPKKWTARFPASLLGIILATLLNYALNWSASMIGAIPQTLLLDDRLSFASIPFANLDDFIAPILTITALGAVESLLCGAVGSNMTGIRLQANQELVAQGIGNMLIPFFGGVPATAAIARSSVGIKSGGQTRLVSIIHAIGLLLSMFLLAPLMGRIPLAALAGVLMVTAVRMSEWDAIRFIFGKRFKTDMIAFTITMLATVVLDLTQAILIGSFLAGAVFLNKIASIDISVQEVDIDRLKQKGIETAGKCKHVRVAFLTGPLFFAATGQFNEAFQNLGDTHALILSMRGVSLIDTAGIEAIHRLHERLHKQSGTLMFAGVHNNVYDMMKRGGLVETIGKKNFFWSSDQAIVEAERRGCKFCL